MKKNWINYQDLRRKLKKCPKCGFYSYFAFDETGVVKIACVKNERNECDFSITSEEDIYEFTK